MRPTLLHRATCLLALILHATSVWTSPVAGDGGSRSMHARGQSYCQVTGDLDKDLILKMHNKERAKTGAQALSWDDNLAVTAQCWANRCKFEHSHTQGLGENIACGNGNTYKGQQGVQQWWDEWKLWQPGMDFTEATGHFTQMAWKATQRVGCGVALCQSSSLGLGSSSYYPKAQFIVCEYDPPGNVIGHFSGQVSLPSGGDDEEDENDNYGSTTPQNKENDNDNYGENQTPATTVTSTNTTKNNGNNNNNGGGKTKMVTTNYYSTNNNGNSGSGKKTIITNYNQQPSNGNTITINQHQQNTSYQTNNPGTATATKKKNKKKTTYKFFKWDYDTFNALFNSHNTWTTQDGQIIPPDSGSGGTKKDRQ